MQVISEEIGKCIQSASWIRRMFEAGIELKQKFGADEVCDFTLGNPDLPPVPQVAFALRSLADTVGQPLSLGYMPNAGLSSTRQRLAEHLAREQKVLLTPSHVIVTCGAAGGLNVVFRAVLEQDDEVICPSPYFVEYGFYAANYRGKLVPVPSKLPGFSLDVDALEAAITPKTRVVLIDSPNNPTGVVYSQDELKELAAVLVRASQEFGRPIYLVSDEPYRFLTYDAVEVPPVLPLYPFAVAVGSFSKSLSLAGERIGYIAVNPAMPQGDELIAGLILCNRILGYVNAPVIGQRVVEAVLGVTVDAEVYKKRRDAMAEVLRNAGVEFVLPKGAFYFFPKVPGTMDDLEFCQLLLDERILAVPGRGFGLSGYFRLTYCMDETIIRRAGEGFKKAADRARAKR
ncbi:MAG TPA: pyridoxal phosphate-dependent aminotransferase [Sedimentisphaerales bacterium]|nr:pyridoxal phosphate-dependent aminotransferase [Phycisphaerae bacterium]HON92721.1 pyridoxal phosphate-dependent aminotransferase [Sedimentisphaerales bacterium]HQI28175.1 pyridoxal phosphate-dependent aminotransferase [Sedimentisphaerales bacterium]